MNMFIRSCVAFLLLASWIFFVNSCGILKDTFMFFHSCIIGISLLLIYFSDLRE